MNKKNTKLVNSLLDFLRNVLAQLTPQERVYFFDDLESYWCQNCGNDQKPGQRCQCSNDE